MLCYTIVYYTTLYETLTYTNAYLAVIFQGGMKPQRSTVRYETKNDTGYETRNDILGCATGYISVFVSIAVSS